MGISLTSKGKKMSFKEFKEAHAFYFKNKPKLDIKKEYERLTGRKVGAKQNNKSDKKV